MTSSPRAQRGDRLVGRGPQAGPRPRITGIVVDHFRDLAALRAQPVEEAPLVLEPAPRDDVDLRVVANRPLHEAGQRRPLEVGEVLAGEEPDQVGGAADHLPVDQLHGHRRCFTVPPYLKGRVSLRVTGRPGRARVGSRQRGP